MVIEKKDFPTKLAWILLKKILTSKILIIALKWSARSVNKVKGIGGTRTQVRSVTKHECSPLYYENCKFGGENWLVWYFNFLIIFFAVE